MRRVSLAIVSVLSLVVACGEEPGLPTGSGLFLNGCPEPDRAVARFITSEHERPHGPDGLAAPGDLLLMNEVAAFVVQGTGETRTYFHQPGVLIDAVAVNGCEQAAPERFGEQAFLIGRLDVSDFTRSALHLFDGQHAEVVNDGSDGGPAVVRVSGIDDPFWLAELELAKSARQDGRVRDPSAPLGVELQVDFVLEPGSPVLQMVLRLTNTTDAENQLLGGSLLILGDSTPAFSASSGQGINMGGFGIRVGVPWIVADSGDGAYALAMDTTNMGTTNVSGVDAMLDIRQATEAPIRLAPAGEEGDSAEVRFFVAAGPTDGNSASRYLEPYQTGPYEFSLVPLAGSVVDDRSGEPIADARILFETKTGTNDWQSLDTLQADGAGEFEGAVADLLGSNIAYRLRAQASGRHDLIREVTPGIDHDVELRMGPAGWLGYRINDGDGNPMPAKVSIYSDGRMVERFYLVDGHGDTPLAPGNYEVSVTRGYEFETRHLGVEVPEDASGALEVSLSRLVDTTGFLSMDGHVHAAPSPDSRVAVSDRLITAAAEGLEIVVGTDHEVITDWSAFIDVAGVRGHVATVVGEELTATIPEHINLYGVPVDESDPRGGPIRWYGKDVEQLYQEAREQGARVISLNHPRLGCSYLCLIEWDRVLGRPLLEDPAAIGLPEGAALWSWNFDVIEYMNGARNVFVIPGQENSTGLFDDWMSFHNHGHRITAVGVTDVHGMDVPGAPRTYFASSTQNPDEYSLDEFEASLKAGRAVVSAGAFARVAIGDAGLGDLAVADEGKVDLQVRIEAIPEIDVSHFKVYANCDEVARVATTDPHGLVKYDDAVSLSLEQDAHVVVLGFGRQPMPRGLTSYEPLRVPRVTTNPIFVDVDGDGVFTAPGGKTCQYTVD